VQRLRVRALDSLGNAKLVRNPHFRPWSAVRRPGGFADEIVVHRSLQYQPSHQDVLGKVHAIERGDIDVGEVNFGGRGLSAAERRGIVTRYPSRIAVAPRLGTDFMFLNVREPPFDDQRVRQAVNFATDRERSASTPPHRPRQVRGRLPTSTKRGG
jgi:peptide/nickel transport system substrate-binding protein